MEESRRLLEKLKFEREQRAIERLNQRKTIETEQIEQVKQVETENEINVQISASKIPSSIRETKETIYYTKSTNTKDLEALTAIQSDHVEEKVDLEKLRKQMEYEIESKLKAEYQKLYTDLIQSKDDSTKENIKVIDSFQPERYHKSVIENLSKLVHPTTAPQYISKQLNNQLLTVHENNLICVWDTNQELKMINSIKSATLVSVAEFACNTDEIILGSMLGTLHLYTFDSQFNAFILSAESTNSFQSPIIGIKSTSETFILITRKAEITIIAANLNDVLKPLRLLESDMILTQIEFIDSSRVLLGDIKGDVYIADIGTFELSQIYISTSILPVISLVYKPTLISGLLAISNLDTSVHVVDLNSKEIIEIAINSFVVDLAWLNDKLSIIYLTENDSCTYDIWSIDDSQMSSKHLRRIESERVSRVIPSNNSILAFNPMGNSVIVNL